jgi:hypothetical protein
VEVVCTPPGGWIQVKNHAIKDAIGWVPQSHLTPLNMTGSRKNSSRRASAPGRALSSLINRASTRRGKGSTPLAVVSLATAQHEYTPSNQVSQHTILTYLLLFPALNARAVSICPLTTFSHPGRARASTRWSDLRHGTSRRGLVAWLP